MIKSNLPWYRLYSHHYFLLQTSLALEKLGFFDLLENGEKLGCEEIASRLKIKMDRTLLMPCLQFLWSTTDILGKDGEKFFLTNHNFHKVLWVLAAYKPVFDNLDKLLDNSMSYGADVLRDGYFLQRASDLFSGDAIKKILESLQNKKIILVDLGCGSARSLIDYCLQNSGCCGVGIDIEPEIIEAAKQNVLSAKLQDRVMLIKADVRQIERWQKEMPSGRNFVFLASTILHEFLREGAEWLVEFFKRFKNIFSGSRFFIVEFDAPSFDDIKSSSDKDKAFFAAMYLLWHPLTKQGMPQSRSVWEKIIKDAGWTLTRVERAKYDLLIYECLL